MIDFFNRIADSILNYVNYTLMADITKPKLKEKIRRYDDFIHWNVSTLCCKSRVLLIEHQWMCSSCGDIVLKKNYKG